jgi:hypothetical protein
MLSCTLGTQEEGPANVLPTEELADDHPSKPLEEMAAAHRARDLSRYATVLDTGFTFWFADGVAGMSLEDQCPSATEADTIPDSWDRDRELAATDNLFDPSFQDTARCRVTATTSIEMSFRTPLDRVAWFPYTGEKPSAADSLEEWLQADVEFNLVARTSDAVNTIGNRMNFVIRPDSLGGGEVRWLIWRISEREL